METITDTATNLNNVGFVIEPVQNLSTVDNSLLIMGLAILLFVCFKQSISMVYNKYVCKLKFGSLE